MHFFLNNKKNKATNPGFLFQTSRHRKRVFHQPESSDTPLYSACSSDFFFHITFLI
jgi:hypothetical protein